jgi:hypothetical protein
LRRAYATQTRRAISSHDEEWHSIKFGFDNRRVELDRSGSAR